MSHWNKFTSKVLEDVNRSMLKEALAEMNVTLDESIKSIRNTWGNEIVDAGLVYEQDKIALGINFKTVNNKEQITLTGDFYGTGLDERTFMDNLSQIYQKHSIIDKLENNGWVVDNVEVNNKDEVVIDAYEYVYA